MMLLVAVKQSLLSSEVVKWMMLLVAVKQSLLSSEVDDAASSSEVTAAAGL